MLRIKSFSPEIPHVRTCRSSPGHSIISSCPAKSVSLPNTVSQFLKSTRFSLNLCPGSRKPSRCASSYLKEYRWQAGSFSPVSAFRPVLKCLLQICPTHDVPSSATHSMVLQSVSYNFLGCGIFYDLHAVIGTAILSQLFFHCYR